MFNLEQAIADWRRQMLAGGIKPVPLEELESHLREEIEREMESGVDGQHAFEMSADRVGRPEALRREFNKIERQLMKRILNNGIAIAELLAGAILMVPACWQLREELFVTNGKLGLMLLGWFLATRALGQMYQFKLHPRESDLETVELSGVKHGLKTGAGILGLLTGSALLIPAAIQALTVGRVEFAGLCYLIFGVALIITGVVVAFRPYKKLRA